MHVVARLCAARCCIDRIHQDGRMMHADSLGVRIQLSPTMGRGGIASRTYAIVSICIGRMEHHMLRLARDKVK